MEWRVPVRRTQDSATVWVKLRSDRQVQTDGRVLKTAEVVGSPFATLHVQPYVENGTVLSFTQGETGNLSGAPVGHAKWQFGAAGTARVSLTIQPA